MTAADEPHSVLGPEGATAWVDGFRATPGWWATEDGDQPEDWVIEAGRARAAVKDSGDAYVHGVTGYVLLADHMRLAAEVDELRARLHWIETRLRGAGAVIAG